MARLYTVNGVTANVSDLAKAHGVETNTVFRRLNRNKWTIEQALGLVPAPPRRYNRRMGINPSVQKSMERRMEILEAVLSGCSAEDYLKMEGL